MSGYHQPGSLEPPEDVDIVHENIQGKIDQSQILQKETKKETNAQTLP